MNNTPCSDNNQYKEISTTEIEETFEIFEQKPDHHFRTELPNIIFELDLDIYERATYTELKRVAGDDGKCWKSNSNLMKAIGCGKTKFLECMQKLSQPFEKLNGKPLIQITHRHVDNDVTKQNETNIVKIINIWPESGAFFRGRGVRQENPPGSPGGPKEDLFKKRLISPPFGEGAIDIDYTPQLELLKLFPTFSESSREKFMQLEVKQIKSVISSCEKKRHTMPPDKFVGYVHNALMNKFKVKDEKLHSKPVKSQEKQPEREIDKEEIEQRRVNVLAHIQHNKDTIEKKGKRFEVIELNIFIDNEILAINDNDFYNKFNKINNKYMTTG